MAVVLAYVLKLSLSTDLLQRLWVDLYTIDLIVAMTMPLLIMLEE